MKQLLAKIKQATATTKCALAAEAHAQLEQTLANLQPLLDSTPAKDLNLEVFDKAIDEIEAVLRALEFLLHGVDTAEAFKFLPQIEKDFTTWETILADRVKTRRQKSRPNKHWQHLCMGRN